MLNIDLTKVLPNRAYEHLASFLPGLFFVSSVLFANPGVARGFSTNSDPGLLLGRYGIIATIAFLAFVIGSGFILVDAFIQFVLFYVYRLKMSLYRLVCRWPLRQLTQWLLTKPRWRSPWLGNLHGLVSTIGTVGFEEFRAQQGCWHVLARRLLQVRYGINIQDFKDDEWEVLYSNLGTPTAEEWRGSMFLIACHATGWAGLTATRFAPVLRDRYYIGFCLFLILNGLLHAYYVVRRKFDPRIAGHLPIRGILREFPITAQVDPQQEKE